MDTQKCWYCDQAVAEDEAVTVNIDGAEEPVHEGCREKISESVSEMGQ